MNGPRSKCAQEVNMRLALARVLVLCFLTFPIAGIAQGSFPDRPIKLVVPFPPGGATDTLARVVGIALGDKLGQPVVIENKPGASTIVAAAYVAKTASDGYTLMLGSNSTLTLNPALRASLPYDAVRSFTFLGPVARMDLVVVVNHSSPLDSLKGLVQRATLSPDKVSYATFGAGSTVHFAAAMLSSSANVSMVHVPFNGSAPSLTALMGNQVDLAVDSLVASAPLIKAGKLRALAVLSEHRSPLVPEVPTAAESGYLNVNLESWFALMAPANLPAAVQRKLETALREVLEIPAVRQKLLELGLTATPGTGTSVISRIDRELPQMRAVAARANMRAD
ncbi:tripartite tricarboxylate transporter substrate binding protein [Ramlibacter solisilvae]